MNLRHQHLNYAAVGLFVLAMLVAGVVSLALLAGRGGARDSYVTVLDNVADIGFGSQVRYEGYPIGQVEKITPFVDGARMRFRIELAIERGWRLPADSVARIGSTSMLSAKTLDIESGDSPDTIAVGGEIPSGSPSDVFTAMADLAADLGDLSRGGLQPLLDRIGTIVERNAPELAERMVSLIARLEASAATLQSVLSQENARSIRATIANAEETSRVFAATSRDLAESMARVDRLVVELDELVAGNRNGVDRSLKDMQHTLATVAQNIDSLVHNLDASSRNMNEFSRLIRQNPGLLLGGTPREEVSSRGTAVEGATQ